MKLIKNERKIYQNIFAWKLLSTFVCYITGIKWLSVHENRKKNRIWMFCPSIFSRNINWWMSEYSKLILVRIFVNMKYVNFVLHLLLMIDILYLLRFFVCLSVCLFVCLFVCFCFCFLFSVLFCFSSGHLHTTISNFWGMQHFFYSPSYGICKYLSE